jgi:TonB family protein
MPDHKKKKHFLNLPEYPGGNAAFKKFIHERLRYPAEAMEAKIEGTVIVMYDVHDDGTVHHARVMKGIGHGCDEEALRVIGLVRFEEVKNRGMRVKVTKKTKINFRLPRTVINYMLKGPVKKEKEKIQPGKNKDEPQKYDYTIRF